MRKKLVKIMVIFGMLILIPSVSANCISYGFFNDENINHRSFLMSNGYHFGNELFVETNCETDIIINDELVISTNSTAVLYVENGIHDIKLVSENRTRSYTSIYVQGGTFLNSAVMMNSTLISEEKIILTQEEFSSKSVGIAIVNSLILFVMVTTVLWKGINFYIDRSYFEEVSS